MSSGGKGRGSNRTMDSTIGSRKMLLCNRFLRGNTQRGLAERRAEAHRPNSHSVSRMRLVGTRSSSTRDFDCIARIGCPMNATLGSSSWMYSLPAVGCFSIDNHRRSLAREPAFAVLRSTVEPRLSLLKGGGNRTRNLKIPCTPRRQSASRVMVKKTAIERCWFAENRRKCNRGDKTAIELFQRFCAGIKGRGLEAMKLA
jgi:hypothetical protein